MSISLQAVTVSTAEKAGSASGAASVEPEVIDLLLLRKVAQAVELIAIGANDSAHAMLTHVLDVAQAEDSLGPLVCAAALPLLAQLA